MENMLKKTFPKSDIIIAYKQLRMTALEIQRFSFPFEHFQSLLSLVTEISLWHHYVMLYPKF